MAICVAIWASVTLMSCIQPTESIFTRPSAYCIPAILVFSYQIWTRYLEGIPLIEGVKWWGYVILTVVWRPLANTFVQAFKIASQLQLTLFTFLQCTRSFLCWDWCKTPEHLMIRNVDRTKVGFPLPVSTAVCRKKAMSCNAFSNTAVDRSDQQSCLFITRVRVPSARVINTGC